MYEPFHQLLSFKKPGQTEAVIKKHGYLKQSIYGVQNKIVSIGFDEDGLISVIYSSIQNLLRHLAECNSIVSEADVNDELLCLSKMSVTLQAKHLTTVIENIVCTLLKILCINQNFSFSLLYTVLTLSLSYLNLLTRRSKKKLIQIFWQTNNQVSRT